MASLRADMAANMAKLTRAVEALTLIEKRRRHKAAMWATLSAASSLADERPRHKVASPNLFDAARGHIQATCKLLAGPLDTILADIECKDIKKRAWMTPIVIASILPSVVDDNFLPAVVPPLVGVPSLPLTVDGNIQKVRPHTQPRCQTGRCNIP